MRLIDADKVNETIDRFIGYLDEDMILRIKMKISKIPTVERPHGEWTIRKRYTKEGNDDGHGLYCSECNTQLITLSNRGLTLEEARKYLKDHIEKNKFCPNCGADMRQKEEKNKKASLPFDLSAWKDDGEGGCQDNDIDTDDFINEIGADLNGW